jgi:hypothetical protein
METFTYSSGKGLRSPKIKKKKRGILHLVHLLPVSLLLLLTSALVETGAGTG